MLLLAVGFPAELPQSGLEPGGVHNRHFESSFGMVHPSASPIPLEAEADNQV